MLKRIHLDFLKTHRKAVVQLAIALVCIVYVAPDYWRAITTYDPLTPFVVFVSSIFAFIHGRTLLDSITSRRDTK